jgi:hypothetical protein
MLPTMKMMNCERWRCCTYPSTRLTLTSTNAQNDALLHRLVHTQLLSGSLNSELGLTSAQRKKAMEGRVLELAGNSKLGLGEKIVRAQERDKASKRVREGLLEKQKQRREKMIQEVIVPVRFTAFPLMELYRPRTWVIITQLSKRSSRIH